MNNKDRLILEYLCLKYGPDVIKEGFFKKLAPAATAAGIVFGGASVAHNMANHRNVEPVDETPAIEQKLSIEDQIPHYHEIVQAVKEYMNWAANCNGYEYDDIEIKPETLVNLCYKYNYDLPMLLSVLHLESCFGVTPRAKRTGSPCSIGCWDNREDKVYYDDQNEAVEAYIKIMLDNFIRGRDFEEAFADGNLVNGLGLRYASSPTYEKDLRGMRYRIFNIKDPDLRNKFGPIGYLAIYRI